ncbi:MAG: hypothetical protein U0903_00060 [Planctomycetales bacterium]
MRDALTGVFILAVVIFVWGYVAYGEIAKLTPPSQDITLQQFVAKMPPPKRLAIVQHGGALKIVWIGETALIAIPSGPSCYVFDSHGKLLDWAWETGEGGPIDAFFSAACEHTPLTIDQALKATGNGAGN